jgi:hypothetical protein
MSRRQLALRIQARAVSGTTLQRKCDCGTHTPGGSACPSCAGQPLQKKLSIGASDDPLEREADRVAETVVAPVQNRAPLRIQRFSFAADAAAEAPQSVERTLSDAGAPLEPTLRRHMEERFGHDFASVRVHTDAAAAQSARDVSARAYTMGHHIVFAPGRYAPATDEGSRLLAHELTHVVQQGNGVARRIVQRDGEDEPVPAKQSKMSFPFAVKISTEMGSDEVLVELVKQYNKVDDAKAKELVGSGQWHWIGAPQSATKADAAKKYVLVTVTVDGVVPVDPRDDKAQKEAFAKLPKDQQDAINAETDREFWDKTHYKPGQKLGNTPDDKKLAEAWKQLRDRLVQEKGLIDKMTPLMKQIVMNPEAIAPKDYEQAARVISKLNTLDAEELADYLSKVTAITSDLDVFEGSVDRFLAARKERKEEGKQREIIKTRLFGTGDLYHRYKQWLEQKKSARGLTATRAPTGELAQKAWDKANDMKAALETDLIAAGFKGGIPDFEKMIASYLDAFQLETGRIANDLLDKYAHVLFEAERKINDPAELDKLYQRIAGSGAKASYDKADALRDEANQMQEPLLSHPQGRGQIKLPHQKEADAKRDEAQKESDSADAAVAGAGGNVPILGEKKMGRRALAYADKATLKSTLQDYIGERRKDIKTSRDAFRDHPELAFKLPDLLPKAYELQDIKKGSIYDEIVQDHINDVQLDDVIVKLAWGALALALGAISGGTGTIAVLAATGAFAISAVQAVQEYKEYEMKSGLSGTGLLSEDPSLFWVIAAVVGAGVDLAAVGGAINDLKPALKVFEETKDVTKFEKALDQLSNVKAEIKANLVKSAADEVKYEKSVEDLLKVSGRAYAFAGVPDPELLWNMSKVAYAAFKRGINTFEKFLLELKAKKIIASIEGITTEQRAVLQKAWINALEEDARLAKIQKVGGRMPLNAKDFAGRTFYFDVSQNPAIKARIIQKYGFDGAKEKEVFQMLDDLAM